jgi:predicted negative regulator of RcsB-dependent stress response
VHFVVDALLQASDARLKLGDQAHAAALLERAAEQLPDDLLVIYRQLLLADAQGSAEKSAALARKLLASVASGPDAASLWLRVYSEAKARGDAAGEMAALEAAAKADPTSVAVQALHMDALTGRRAEGDGALLAAALETAAGQVESAAAKARFYLQAAWEWSSLARDGAAARAALVRAGEQGVGPAVLARTARSLAALARDEAWFDEATEAVLASGPADAELSGLWFELVRGRLLRGDREGADKAIEGLVGAPGGEWAGRVLGAYVVERGESGRARALDALAEVEPVAAVAQALSVAAARRAQQGGDTSGIKARLEGILRADAGDVVATTYLSERLRSEGDVEGAAGILQAATAASDDEALKAAFSLESALLLWRSGKRERALEPLAAVKAWAPEAGAALLAWAQRGVGGPDSSVTARRRALELAGEAGQEPAVTAIERFGLELGAGQVDEARGALEALENESQGALRLAAALARVIWPAVQADRIQLDEALSLLATVGDSGAGLAAAERARLARDVDESKVDYARQAATWAELEPSLVTGLEWLSSAMAIADGEAEAGAHRLLASQLDGDAKAAEEAESLTVQWLTAGGLLPNLLPSAAPAAQLLNLELAPAGSDPRRRSGALKGVGGVLGEQGGVDTRALAGWSDLAAGEAEEALETFRKVVARRPDDIGAWEGLRTAALQLSDTPTRAEATAKLGALCRDPARGAAFLEEAGLIWLDQLNQPDRGEQALAASFARDARRAVAFDKLFRRVRGRQEDDRLVELASRRLEVADDAAEIVKLYWEQARILHKKADYSAALEALTNVTMFEPDHVGALVVLGDIHSKQGTFDEAAEAYAQLAAHKDAPAQQRLIAGVKAVDLYEKRLGKVQEALDVLVGLHKAGLTTLPVRERLAALAAKGGAWTEATSMLEALMAERETSEARIEAARLSMAIWRDKVGDPKGARRAVMRLLEESPTDGEALDLVLATDFPASMKSHTLGAGKTAIVQQLQRGALDPEVVARLSRIAKASEDAGLLQASLGVLVSLGQDHAATEQLAELEIRTAKVPQIQIDARGLANIGDPLDTGPITRLFEVMGEIISEAMGPTKDALNVGRKERVDPRSGLALRNDIAAWAGALGLGEFELYIGGRDPNGVQGVGGEVPALVVGAGIKSPLSASVRQAIAREIFALRRGITVVRTKDEAYVASIAVATCNLAEMQLEAPAFAVLGDVQRLLGKAMNRKVRKLLPEICQQVVASKPDLRGWARAAQRSLDRMSAIAAGDVSLVLADTLATPRNELKRQIAGNERAERLLRFVLSPQYLELRNHLGMGVR